MLPEQPEVITETEEEFHSCEKEEVKETNDPTKIEKEKTQEFAIEPSLEVEYQPESKKTEEQKQLTKRQKTRQRQATAAQYKEQKNVQRTAAATPPKNDVEGTLAYFTKQLDRSRGSVTLIFNGARGSSLNDLKLEIEKIDGVQVVPGISQERSKETGEKISPFRIYVPITSIDRVSEEIRLSEFEKNNSGKALYVQQEGKDDAWMSLTTKSYTGSAQSSSRGYVNARRWGEHQAQTQWAGRW